jgi:hypothetical protein
MATDARGHTIPAATDVPSRNTLLNLSLSTCDVVPVTNTTTRATAVTNLGATTAKPLIVARADARADSLLEMSSDSGTTWRTSVLGSGLQTYTPVLTAATTNPTLGTGSSVAGEFERFGDWVVGAVEIVWGTSGVAAGSGFYEISLPVAMVASGPTAGRIIGSGVIFDSSAAGAAAWFLVSVTAVSSTTCRGVMQGFNPQSGVSPVVPAASDQIRITFAYRAA